MAVGVRPCGIVIRLNEIMDWNIINWKPTFSSWFLNIQKKVKVHRQTRSLKANVMRLKKDDLSYKKRDIDVRAMCRDRVVQKGKLYSL